MRSIREALELPLRWSQLRQLKWEYELRAEDDLIATLGFSNTFSSLAMAKSADGAWTFKRSGFLPKVTVRAAESGTEVGFFKADWKSYAGRGSLLLSTGKEYHWVNTSLLCAEWMFADMAGKRLIHFFDPADSGVPFPKIRANVKIETCADPATDLFLLATLGWYLMIYGCWWQNCCRQ